MASESIETIVLDVVSRRSQGEPLSDAEVVAAHPEAAPILQRELSKLAVIHRARILSALPPIPAELGMDRTTLPNAVAQGYTILREINRGGQASVFLAKRHIDSSLVAVKLLHPRVLEAPDDRARFLREVEILAELDHPSIVSVVDHGQTVEGQPYLVMNYVDGEPLQAAELSNRLALAERLALFCNICEALNEAHRRGIVHRDLKPSNIRIDRAGRPHLLDFGLAQRLSPDLLRHSLTVTGQFVGTYLWASPEQRDGPACSGGSITPASDVYSIGVVLYQLVTGGSFPPVVYETVQCIVEGRAGPRATKLPAVGNKRLAKVISRCLEADPARRYANAGELRAAVMAVPISGNRWPMLIGLAAVLFPATLPMWIPAAGPPDYVSNVARVVNGKAIVNLAHLPPLVWIPAGEFDMGSSTGTEGYPDERPQRRVKIAKGFYMAMYETTQEHYLAVMGTNPARFSANTAFPVERVTYTDAAEFCRRVSKATGRIVRLPTEAEWEYACRAGTKTRFTFGDDARMFRRYGNLADRSVVDPGVGTKMDYNDGSPATAIPGSFVSNVWGLYDMYGNVWEWCQAPYLIDPSDPTTARPDLASARGGSWFDAFSAARPSNRNPLSLGTKTSTLGFRVVVEEE